MMVYILGGTGFVGSAFVRLCKRNNIEFVSINRNNYKTYAGTKCSVLINANGNSKKYIANTDEMFEFDASVRSVKSSLIDFKYDKYIYLSSCDVYPDCSNESSTDEKQKIDIMSQSNYGFHKYLAELCVIHGDNNWLLFRVGGLVGKGLRKNPVFDIVNDGRLWINRKSKLQFMNTDRLAESVLMLHNNNVSNQIFNIAGRDVIEMEEVAKVAKKEIISDGNSVVTYNISIDKISNYIDIEKTADAVERFLKVLNNRM